MKKRVCMIGEGAWGTAVATLLAHNGYAVKLWCHDATVADSIMKTGFNHRYLPGIKLDPSIEATDDLTYAVSDVPLIFEAIPVQFLRSVIEQIRDAVTEKQTWVVLS
ncbi:MAG: 2-dehydropantoate 2-reductase N-terminal domain-containing protein, partial [bacterium]|nr:2-dehydropantoate 2-reductase N-terminal domain-containing protein [bacterium]